MTEQRRASDTELSDQLRTLGERNAHLTEIVALGTALQTCDTTSALAGHVTSSISKLVGTEQVALALVDRAPHWLVPPLGPATMPLSLQAITAHLTDKSRLGTLTYHVGASPELPAFEDAVLLVIPDRQSQVLGIILFDIKTRPSTLTPDLVQVLEILANQVAIALNNLALAAEQRQTVDRLTALNALSLAVNTAQLGNDRVVQMAVAGAVGTTEASGGGVIVVGKGGVQTRHVLSLPPSIGTDVESMIDMIHDDYVELRGNDVPPSARAAAVQGMLVVPMRGTKRMVGLLWLGFGQPAITRTEREMAVLYAKMAAAVIENFDLLADVRAAEERKAAVLASTREGILMVDQDRHVSVVNSSFGALLGVAPSRLIGLPVSQLREGHALLGVAPETVHAMFDAVDDVLRGSRHHVEGEFVLTDAVLLHIHWTVTPAHGATGDSVGALLVANDVTAARQIEKLRTDTSNMIVHDLRAPLTNLMISVDLLTKQIVGPLTKEQGRILNIAAASCQQMLDMVNDLLDIRRLESQSVTLNRQPAGLGPIVDVIIERLERWSTDRQITFINQLDDTPPVTIDVEMVRRLLQNLMDNALKFSNGGGEITISCRVLAADALPFPHSDGQWVVVAVQDEGPGIPEAYRSHIFQLFSQAPGGAGRGTGLGLAFCKLAVEAHGGTIWVESVVGQGSTFYFTLPVAHSTVELPTRHNGP